MITAFSRGLAQLSDPRIRRVVWFAIAAACIAFALLWSAVGTVLGATSFFSIFIYIIFFRKKKLKNPNPRICEIVFFFFLKKKKSFFF